MPRLTLLALLACLIAAPAFAQGTDTPPAEAPPASLAQQQAEADRLLASGALDAGEEAEVLFALAEALLPSDPAGSASTAEGALAKALAAADNDTARVQALRRAADILNRAGRRDAAIARLQQAQALEAGLGADNPARRFVLADLAGLLEAAGRESDAAPLKAEAGRLETLEAGREQTVVTMGGGRDDPKAAFQLVNVFYVTNRKATGSADPYRTYAGAPGAVTYGRVRVSVPRMRDLGAVPRPSIWALDISPDPKRHVLITSVTRIKDRQTFVAAVGGQMARSSRKEAFVFIHGFNTAFDGAATRAAQLAIDLEVDGAPILFSWPSQGQVLGYGADEVQATSEVSVAALTALLEDVALWSGARRIYVVAHSMGNRPTLRALGRLRTLKPPAGRATLFDEVVFAAPDVPQDEFKTRVAALKGISPRMTLYASKRDRALQLSAVINQALRAGDATPPLVLPGLLDTVDTTAATQGLLGHTDFAGTARDDVRAVLWAGLPPSKRCKLTRSGGNAWAFGGSCEDASFRVAIWFWRRAGDAAKALAAFDRAIAQFQVQASAGGAGAEVAQRNVAAYGRARQVLVGLGLP